MTDQSWGSVTLYPTHNVYGQPASGGGIPEAPSDGTTYGRNNAAWVHVIPTAPVDGTTYGRQSGNWVNVVNLNGDNMKGPLVLGTLRLQPGPNANPKNGDLWYDATHLYFYHNGTTTTLV